MWIVTFSDLMSLLLTFFVLLLSFSTISEEKFEEAANSIRGALSLLPLQAHIIAPMPRPPKKSRKEAEAKELEERMKAARQLQRQLQVKGQEKKVKVEFDALGGLKINLPNAALFDIGSADLKAEAYSLLRDLGSVLKEMPEAFIEIRGHTDNRPITSNGRFRDNRDLSYFRAYSVSDYLASTAGIPSSQFEVHALGEYQPLASNETEAGRTANRRVELFVRGPIDKSKIEPFIKRIEREHGNESPGTFALMPYEFEGMR